EFGRNGELQTGVRADAPVVARLAVGESIQVPPAGPGERADRDLELDAQILDCRRALHASLAVAAAAGDARDLVVLQPRGDHLPAAARLLVDQRDCRDALERPAAVVDAELALTTLAAVDHGGDQPGLHKHAADRLGRVNETAGIAAEVE